jgi:hypothetical protein
MRLVSFGLVSLALASAMHLDWHAARPAAHPLSLGWSWHWLLAVPVGALTAWYVVRTWPVRPAAASVGMFGIASVLAAVVEPAWEYWVDGAPYEWAFGSPRLAAFAMFVAAGAITHLVVLIVARGRMRR